MFRTEIDAATGEVKQIDLSPDEIAELEAVASRPQDPADYDLLPWQITAMVNYLGVDPAIRQAISAIPDAMMKAAALARYEKATSYHYGDPLVEQLRAAIKLPEKDLIDAWLLAKDLRSSN